MPIKLSGHETDSRKVCDNSWYITWKLCSALPIVWNLVVSALALGFEVLAAIEMTMLFFWIVMPCVPFGNNQIVAQAYSLHIFIP